MVEHAKIVFIVFIVFVQLGIHTVLSIGEMHTNCVTKQCKIGGICNNNDASGYTRSCRRYFTAKNCKIKSDINQHEKILGTNNVILHNISFFLFIICLCIIEFYWTETIL